MWLAREGIVAPLPVEWKPWWVSTGAAFWLGLWGGGGLTPEITFNRPPFEACPAMGHLSAGPPDALGLSPGCLDGPWRGSAGVPRVPGSKLPPCVGIRFGHTEEVSFLSFADWDGEWQYWDLLRVSTVDTGAGEVWVRLHRLAAVSVSFDSPALKLCDLCMSGFILPVSVCALSAVRSRHSLRLSQGSRGWWRGNRLAEAGQPLPSPRPSAPQDSHSWGRCCVLVTCTGLSPRCLPTVSAPSLLPTVAWDFLSLPN